MLPEFAKAASDAVLTTAITPLPAVVKVPPVMATEFTSRTSDPASAEMMPPVFVNAPKPDPVSWRMPPPLARIVPWFRKAFAMFCGSTVRIAALTFASIRPPAEFVIAIESLPMLPWPLIVLLLVSRPEPLMIANAPPSVVVPVPLRETFPLMVRYV